jgi:two-component system sensor histidine kinase ArlS
MTRKLLNKTLRVYAGFSVIVLLVSTPLFYWLTEKLFIEDADETLYLRKDVFLRYTLPEIKMTDIPTWNKINHDVRIDPRSHRLSNDSLFYRSYIDSIDYENEPYRVLLTPIAIEQSPYTLLVRINLVESADVIEGIALLFSVIVATLLTGMYFINRRLSSQLWLPFYSTLLQVEQFKLDKNVKPDFIATNVEEFSRLNQSISRLLENNIAAYNNQKEFIENAAHELQTPLGVFQAKLDLLVEQVPLTNDLAVTLTKLNLAASRLNRINKNLLLLSKITNGQYNSLENVHLGELLIRQTEFLTEQAKEKEVTVHLREGTDFSVTANATLLEIAISNVLLNALRHNRRKGTIGIHFTGKQLKISNTSEQDVLERARLFERFSGPARDGGTGLGLAIVKKICDLHGWTLEYAFEEGTHVFTIVF